MNDGNTFLRCDDLTGRIIVVASERAHRPKCTSKKGAECPFCEGREHMTPPEVYAYPAGNRLPDSKGWKVRVVPNKFPAFRDCKTDCSYEEWLSDSTCDRKTRAAKGFHEVVIHSPAHDKNIDEMEDREFLPVMEAVLQRRNHLMSNPNIEYVSVITNCGEASGASLEHPHSQIFAMDFVPPSIKKRLDFLKAHYLNRGKCFFCEEAAKETGHSQRIVLNGNNFLVYAPYASEFPYMIRILPKRHVSDIESLKDLEGFHEAVSLSIVGLKRIFGNPDYNIIYHFPPKEKPGSNISLDNTYHWYAELIPRVSTIAGFEIGCGVMINIFPPEGVASDMRKAIDGVW